MKKSIKLTIAFLALILVFGYLYFNKQSKAQKGTKEVTIEIIVEDESIKTITETTNATTLAEFLIELQDKDLLELSYQTTTWGMYIQNMEGYEEEPSKGKYWTHDSHNNKQCVENNFCDGADSLNIGDGDYFTFTLDNE